MVFLHSLVEAPLFETPVTQILDALRLDARAETERIVGAIRATLSGELMRRGVVLGMSGGVDSSVCAALAARAVGAKRVLALFMPERDSDPLSLTLACNWAETLGIPYIVEDITPVLEGARCYWRRDEAIRRLIPQYGEGWRAKLVLPESRSAQDSLNVSRLVVESPVGDSLTMRLPAPEYLQIVAATSFKQRTRKMLEYYHADRQHYAVVGTANRLERDQGFFVKGGDGAADLMPLAHLYKTQVYQLAEFLGVPAEITSRPPSSDTYSLPQSQEEFYFSLPPGLMDQMLFAFDNVISAESAAAQCGLSVEEVRRTYRDIEQKRRTTRPLHLPAILVDPLREAAVD